MFTVTTSEIRWFFIGSIPQKVDDWLFKLNGEIESQAPRNDVYLNTKDNSNLGIKFREGRFEVKQKMADLVVLDSGNISGNSELWKKWSFEAKDENIPLADISKGEWLKISKSRKLKKYIFTESGDIIEGFDNYKSGGCNLELTEVKTHPFENLSPIDESQAIWWSLGLEIYGQSVDLFQNLQIAFQYVFKSDFPVTLKSQQSFGYPKWCSRFYNKRN